MDLVAVEINNVGMTVEESLLATELEGKRLEHEGKLMFVKGVLTRGKAYADYIAEGYSQRTAAKFFGCGKSTINDYLKVSSSAGHLETFEQMEDPSLRKMLAVVKPPKEKEEVIDVEVEETITYTKEEIMQIIANNMVEFDELAKEFGYSKGEGGYSKETIMIDETELDLEGAKENILMLNRFLEYAMENGGELMPVKTSTTAIVDSLLGVETVAGVSDKELKLLVKKAGSQGAFAKLCGVSPGTVSVALKGKGRLNKKIESYVINNRKEAK